MAVACLASIAIFAGGIALYGLDWYKNRRRQNRKLAKKLVVQEGRTTTTKEEQQPIAEQLA
ncbi:MAG: hypothetical protein ACJ71O_10250 [Nitrososphaeraceae archaeon]